MRYFPTMILEYLALTGAIALIVYSIATTLDSSLLTILSRVCAEML